MTPFRPLVLTWIALLLLLAAEACGTRLLGWGSLAPACGALMAFLVAAVFMDARGTTDLSRIFAIGAVFWLCVLLGLGSVDPLTRHDVYITSHGPS